MFSAMAKTPEGSLSLKETARREISYLILLLKAQLKTLGPMPPVIKQSLTQELNELIHKIEKIKKKVEDAPDA